MNEEQADRIINILERMEEKMQKPYFDEYKINDELKEFIPDDFEQKTANGKTISINKGLFIRKQIINIFKKNR